MAPDIPQNSDSMKYRLFLSWSGTLSQEIGLLLKKFLEGLIDELEVWMSTEDLGQGVSWQQSILTELKESSSGMICVTKDNCERPWLLFESGALVQQVKPGHRLYVIAVGIEKNEVPSPLNMFQVTSLNERQEIEKLVADLRKSAYCKADDDRFASRFEPLWEKLQRDLKDVLSAYNKRSATEPNLPKGEARQLSIPEQSSEDWGRRLDRIEQLFSQIVAKNGTSYRLTWRGFVPDTDASFEPVSFRLTFKSGEEFPLSSIPPTGKFALYERVLKIALHRAQAANLQAYLLFKGSDLQAFISYRSAKVIAECGSVTKVGLAWIANEYCDIEIKFKSLRLFDDGEMSAAESVESEERPEVENNSQINQKKNGP